MWRFYRFISILVLLQSRLSISEKESLPYAKYKPFGLYNFSTIQVCETQQDAHTHWETQKKYNERYVIHPIICTKHRGKYVLVFPKVLRLFKI